MSELQQEIRKGKAKAIKGIFDRVSVLLNPEAHLPVDKENLYGNGQIEDLSAEDVL